MPPERKPKQREESDGNRVGFAGRNGREADREWLRARPQDALRQGCIGVEIGDRDHYLVRFQARQFGERPQQLVSQDFEFPAGAVAAVDPKAPVVGLKSGTGVGRIQGLTGGGRGALLANVGLQAVKQGAPGGGALGGGGPDFRPDTIVGGNRVEQQEGAHGLLTERDKQGMSAGFVWRLGVLRVSGEKRPAAGDIAQISQ